MRTVLQYATSRRSVKRGLKIALIVGTIYAFINHYDAIFFGAEWTPTRIFQLILTYLVSYSVSSLSTGMEAHYEELVELRRLVRMEREELSHLKDIKAVLGIDESKK
jgi:hypothetical protein